MKLRNGKYTTWCILKKLEHGEHEFWDGGPEASMRKAAARLGEGFILTRVTYERVVPQPGDTRQDKR